MKKFFAYLLLLVAASPAMAQSTLQLSASPTFQSKASLSGANFTGPISLVGNPQFYLSNIFGRPGINYAAGAFTTYDASSNSIGSYIGNAEQLRVTNGAVYVFGAFSASSAIHRTNDFYMDVGSGPYLNFAPGVYVTFENNKFQFRGTAGTLATIDMSGNMVVRGSVTANGNP